MATDSRPSQDSFGAADRFPVDEISIVDWDHWLHQRSEGVNGITAADVFGPSAAGGRVHRWGVAAAEGQPLAEKTVAISRMGCDLSVGKSGRSIDWKSIVEAFSSSLDSSPRFDVPEAGEAVRFAAAIGALTAEVPASTSHNLVVALLNYQTAVLQSEPDRSPVRLIAGAELGLTLAWRLLRLRPAKKIRKPASDALAAWCRDAESEPTALETPNQVRMVLASILRCERLSIANRWKIVGRPLSEIAQSLSIWAAALTTTDGGSAFSSLTRSDLKDDVGGSGLLREIVAFDPETIRPSVEAALGESKSGGKLAWQVSLPESMQHSPDARVAVLQPEWDVRRGRTHVHYRGRDVTLRVDAGRNRMIDGDWQCRITIDGRSIEPTGDWEDACDYSDDDVHYLELQQTWSDGWVLQRQFMQVREDRCLLLSDAIVPVDASDPADVGIEYECELPIDASVTSEPTRETTEIFLHRGGRQSLVIPLAAGEWQIGATDAVLSVTDGKRIRYQVRGKGRLYSPLWFDFYRRRFKRKRTWRQLTVGEDLRLCRRDEAVAFRVQAGSEHWTLYRSLQGSVCRTFMGKHLVADFYASRFHPGDGDHEALVTVDDE